MRRLSVMFGLAVSILASALATTAALAQTVPLSLQGESFFGSVRTQGSCDPEQNSTITFTASGTATGPYTGSFEETGIVTIAPQTLETGVGSQFGFKSGPILMLHSSFKIRSPEGQVIVTGTKDFVVPADGAGVCATTEEPAPSLGDICRNFGGTGALRAEDFQVAAPQLQYEAVITPISGGSFRDSGTASLGFLDLGITCSEEDLGSGGTFGAGLNFFSEQFPLSSGVVPLTTPGQATGGGQINHVSGGTGVTFGFTAYSRGEGSIRAHCNVVEEDVHIVCQGATQYSQVGNNATFAGIATINGIETTYRIDVQDNAESGIGRDTFAIATGSGYTASGVLTQGNIQVHPHPLTQ